MLLSDQCGVPRLSKMSRFALLNSTRYRSPNPEARSRLDPLTIDFNLGMFVWNVWLPTYLRRPDEALNPHWGPSCRIPSSTNLEGFSTGCWAYRNLIHARPSKHGISVLAGYSTVAHLHRLQYGPCETALPAAHLLKHFVHQEFPTPYTLNSPTTVDGRTSKDKE